MSVVWDAATILFWLVAVGFAASAAYLLFCVLAEKWAWRHRFPPS